MRPHRRSPYFADRVGVDPVVAIETIHVPPLREREGDVEVLTHHFLDQFARETPAFGGKTLAPSALVVLREYHFPGNVRELKNVVESMLILSNKGVITQESFERYLREKSLHDTRLPVPTGRTSQSAEHQLIIHS